jgi:hypothetical protein
MKIVEDAMTDALARLRADVTRDDVLRAIQEYDRLGPERFFSEHGFGPSRSYELVWDERRYPHKAILGTAYEFATGQHFASGDFDGGKSGAVAVLRKQPGHRSGESPLPASLASRGRPWTERGPALMIANRPQIDRPRPPGAIAACWTVC